MRYRPELPLVLKNITFDVLPEEKVGVVGRTGSGVYALPSWLREGHLNYLFVANKYHKSVKDVFQLIQVTALPSLLHHSEEVGYLLLISLMHEILVL